MDAFRRQVAGLVVEPEPPPLILDLSQVFRLVEQLLHADIRLAGILVQMQPLLAQSPTTAISPRMSLRTIQPPCAGVPPPRDLRPAHSPLGRFGVSYNGTIGMSGTILEFDPDFPTIFLGAAGK